MSEDRFTTKPPAGAAPLIVRVPVAVFPPETFAGAIVRPWTIGEVTVTWLVRGTPFALAVTVTVVAVCTGVELRVKVPEDAPAAIVTEAGTVPTGLFEERVTTIPPVGAGAVRVTVPVDVVPPRIDVGLNASVAVVGAVMVSAPEALVPFAVALMFAVTGFATPTVVTVTETDVAP